MNLRALTLVPLLAALLGACNRQAPTPASSAATGERVFETRGVVRAIATNGLSAIIRHEEIPGYMPRMVMELRVLHARELLGIQPNDEITFRLHATEDTHWIDQVRKTGMATQDSPPTPLPRAAAALPELKPGDPLPDATFLSERGEPVRFSEFRGQALAFTFFFTRCPLPDYCPRMNRHFSQARALLLQRPQAPTNWSLLCVSFDPAHDTPEVLAAYARAYRGQDTNRWTFATAPLPVLTQLAPRLDLIVTRESDSISHNLRTVVVDTQGRIHRQFDGNEWTPTDLADAIAEAARPPDSQPPP